MVNSVSLAKKGINFIVKKMWDEDRPASSSHREHAVSVCMQVAHNGDRILLVDITERLYCGFPTVEALLQRMSHQQPMKFYWGLFTKMRLQPEVWVVDAAQQEGEVTITLPPPLVVPMVSLEHNPQACLRTNLELPIFNGRRTNNIAETLFVRLGHLLGPQQEKFVSSRDKWLGPDDFCYRRPQLSIEPAKQALTIYEKLSEVRAGLEQFVEQ